MLKALLLGSALSLPAGATAASLGAEQFAFNMPIELQSDTPLYSASVPNTVYESVTRAELSDVRVFNAAGEQVPHTFRLSPPHCSSGTDGDWRTLDATNHTSQDGSRPRHEFEYDAAAWLPIDTVIVEFPKRNTIAAIEVLSRENAEQEWQLRYRGPAYELQGGGLTRSSEPIGIDNRAHRYWRLSIDAAGGGVGQGAPWLRVAWRAHELLFMARGEGPYKLALGNATISRPPDAVTKFFEPVQYDLGTDVLGVAVLRGAIKEIDRAYLEAPTPPLPWERITLWVVLIAGVSVLGLLAFSLIRGITPA